MKKLLFFLLLMTAVVGREQTSLDLLPVGTEAPDFTITDSKTGKKIFQPVSYTHLWNGCAHR